MLTYWSGIQETRKPYKEGRDELLDTWHTLLIPKVVAALLPEKETEQMCQMKQLSEWLSTSLCFTPGTLGGIKLTEPHSIMEDSIRDIQPEHLEL